MNSYETTDVADAHWQDRLPHRATRPALNAMTRAPGTVVMSVNAAWNLVNFRGSLIEHLLSSGYEVVAMAPEDEHARRLVEMGCRFIPIAIDNKGANPLKDLALFKVYLDLLRREAPIAYLGFTIKPNVYGSLAAQRLGIPVINNISGLGTAFIRDTWLTPVVKVLYRTALRRSHTVYFQNGDDRQMFVDLKLVRPEQTEILPGSGVDIQYFAPPTSGDPMARNVARDGRFLLIARLLWDKGIGEYVEAARTIKVHNPGVTFAVLGFLDVENRTAVSREDMAAWTRDGLIEYLGATNDVRPFIAAADCVVLPSYREGTSRTLLEAAAMGKPLIATDVPGCRNVVEHGRNGYVCRVRDAADLARQMSAFLSLPAETMAEMGRQSRQKIEREFDQRFVIDRYMQRLAVLSEGQV